MKENKTVLLKAAWLAALALILLAGSGPPGSWVSTAQAQAPAAAPPPPWGGMWSGKGIIRQKLMDDPIRKLTRSSEVDFWFVVDPNGRVHGQGFIAYSAELKAMKWKVPVPNMGTIDAEVAGSSGKIIHRFGVAGTLTDTPRRAPGPAMTPGGTRQADHGRNHENCEMELTLYATGTGENGQPAQEVDSLIPGLTFDFKIEASVNVPAGAGGVSVAPGAQPGMQVIAITAKGWSPFQGLKPKVERGPGEPLRVMAEDKGEKHYILWYAVQQSAR
jgi:hypothetical protein